MAIFFMGRLDTYGVFMGRLDTYGVRVYHN